MYIFSCSLKSSCSFHNPYIGPSEPIFLDLLFRQNQTKWVPPLKGVSRAVLPEPGPGLRYMRDTCARVEHHKNVDRAERCLCSDFFFAQAPSLFSQPCLRQVQAAGEWHPLYSDRAWWIIRRFMFLCRLFWFYLLSGVVEVMGQRSQFVFWWCPFSSSSQVVMKSQNYRLKIPFSQHVFTPSAKKHPPFS